MPSVFQSRPEMQIDSAPEGSRRVLTPEETELGISLPTVRDISPLQTAAVPGTHRLRELCDMEGCRVLDVLRDVNENVDPGCWAPDENRKIRKGGFFDLAEDIVPLRMYDSRTAKLIEIDKIWDELTKGSSLAGKLAISRAVMQPSKSEAMIRAKQKAYLELLENRQLCNALLRFNDKWTNRIEKRVLKFSLHGWSFSDPFEGYGPYWKVRGAFLGLCRTLEKCPEPKSPYLRMLIEDILAIRETRFFKLLEGGIVRTAQGLKTEEEAAKHEGFRGPSARFLPWSVTPAVLWLTLPGMIGTGIATFGFLKAGYALNLIKDAAERFGRHMMLTAGGLAYMGLAAGLVLGVVRAKKQLDNESVAKPMEELALSDDSIDRVIESAGRIGELMAGVRFLNDARVPLSVPCIRDSDRHYVVALGLGSPLFWKDPSYVRSNLKMFEHSLLTLTGPNSGGKTTTGRTLLLVQILSQMGLMVPVQRLELAIADWIGYQAREEDSQDNREGNFGTTHARARDVALPATGKSLLVFDELGQGATHQEGTERALEVSELAAAKGASAVVITHNLELAKILEERGLSESLQVEFEKGAPTHRVIPGIAVSSYSEAIAERIRFSGEAMRQHLRDGGYIK